MKHHAMFYVACIVFALGVLFGRMTMPARIVSDALSAVTKCVP